MPPLAGRAKVGVPRTWACMRGRGKEVNSCFSLQRNCSSGSFLLTAFFPYRKYLYFIVIYVVSISCVVEAFFTIRRMSWQYQLSPFKCVHKSTTVTVYDVNVSGIKMLLLLSLDSDDNSAIGAVVDICQWWQFCFCWCWHFSAVAVLLLLMTFARNDNSVVAAVGTFNECQFCYCCHWCGCRWYCYFAAMIVLLMLRSSFKSF